MSPLYIACSNDNLEVAELLLDYGADVHFKHMDTEEATALHMASISGCVEVARLLLLNRGGDINARSSMELAPLHSACFEGHFGVAQQNRVININAKEYRELTPLHFACANKHMEIIRLLVQNGADLHIEDKIQERHQFIGHDDVAEAI